MLVLYANIRVTEKNRISEYKIIVYADHLSFLGKWSFFIGINRVRNMIKVVFMDIDDTIFDFSAFVKKAMKDGFEKYGLPHYKDEMFFVFNEVNNKLWRSAHQKKLTIQELNSVCWNKFFKEMGISFDSRIFEEYFCEELYRSAIFEPNALELIKYLDGKYIMCVASNAPCAQQMNRLKVGGIDTFFSHAFISSTIGAKKPDKAFFDYCFRELRKAGCENLMPEETIIIGDSVTSDIAGGRNYGMKTCLYTKGQKSDMTCEKADYIVSDLSDIMKIL